MRKKETNVFLNYIKHIGYFVVLESSELTASTPNIKFGYWKGKK